MNYQDNHPEIALERDIAEKKIIIPFLNIKGSSRIIDIGCGVVRWGDELIHHLKSGTYIGVDYSKSLIDIAIKSKTPYENNGLRKYCVGSFQDIKNILKMNHVKFGFDIAIINGVFMYINDRDIDICIQNVLDIINEKAIIYIKESVGIEARYTLKNIYSDELSSDYNAIYRSVDEYFNLFEKYFLNFKYISDGEMYLSDKLNNRKETMSYYLIYQSI